LYDGGSANVATGLAPAWPGGSYKANLDVTLWCDNWGDIAFLYSAISYVNPAISTVAPYDWCQYGGTPITISGTNMGIYPQNFYTYVSVASYQSWPVSASCSSTTVETCIATAGIHWAPGPGTYSTTPLTLYLAWNNPDGSSGPYTTLGSAGAYDYSGGDCYYHGYPSSPPY